MATRFSTRAHRLRLLLVFGVFVLLIVNMLGVVDFRALVGGQLRINSALLADTLRGNLGAATLLMTVVIASLVVQLWLLAGS